MVNRPSSTHFSIMTVLPLMIRSCPINIQFIEGSWWLLVHKNRTHTSRSKTLDVKLMAWRPWLDDRSKSAHQIPSRLKLWFGTERFVFPQWTPPRRDDDHRHWPAHDSSGPPESRFSLGETSRTRPPPRRPDVLTSTRQRTNWQANPTAALW